MTKYVCTECGKNCYSACTDIKQMTEPSCPYCGGEIKGGQAMFRFASRTDPYYIGAAIAICLITARIIFLYFGG